MERKVLSAGRQLQKSVIWGWTTAVETGNSVSDTKQRYVGCEIPEPRWHVHLLAVEEDDKLDRVDEWKQRAKESPCPNHSLTVDQHQNVGGNHKFLSSQLLHQLVRRVVYHHPDADTQANALQSRDYTSYAAQDLMWCRPSWKLHQHQRSNGDEQVEHGQLVHLLSDTRFPALSHTRTMSRWTRLWDLLLLTTASNDFAKKIFQLCNNSKELRHITNVIISAAFEKAISEITQEEELPGKVYSCTDTADSRPYLGSRCRWSDSTAWR